MDITYKVFFHVTDSTSYTTLQGKVAYCTAVETTYCQVIVAYFTTVSQHLYGRTVKIYEKSQPG